MSDLEQAIARLDRATWDSRTQPSKADVRALLDAYVTPKGWTIREGRWPEPAWLATHDDFDASYEGPEDGWVGNGLSCHANTRGELLVEIGVIEEEHPHFCGCDNGKVWNNADPTSGQWVPCEKHGGAA